MPYRLILQQISFDDLKKAKALFEIKTLPAGGPYPDIAVKVSNAAMGAVFLLVNETEDNRNTGVFYCNYNNDLNLSLFSRHSSP